MVFHALLFLRTIKTSATVSTGSSIECHNPWTQAFSRALEHTFAKVRIPQMHSGTMQADTVQYSILCYSKGVYYEVQRGVNPLIGLHLDVVDKVQRTLNLIAGQYSSFFYSNDQDSIRDKGGIEMSANALVLDTSGAISCDMFSILGGYTNCFSASTLAISSTRGGNQKSIVFEQLSFSTALVMFTANSTSTGICVRFNASLFLDSPAMKSIPPIMLLSYTLHCLLQAVYYEAGSLVYPLICSANDQSQLCTIVGICVYPFHP